jgi:hypothetical protein
MTPRSRYLHQRSRCWSARISSTYSVPRANADEKAESLAGPAQASRRDQGGEPSVLTPSRSFDRQLLPFGTHLESRKTERCAAKIPRPSRPPNGFSHAWAADNSGQPTRTLVPEPGRDSTWKEPPSNWARSRMPARPSPREVAKALRLNPGPLSATSSSRPSRSIFRSTATSCPAPCREALDRDSCKVRSSAILISRGAHRGSRPSCLSMCEPLRRAIDVQRGDSRGALQHTFSDLVTNPGTDDQHAGEHDREMRHEVAAGERPLGWLQHVRRPRE